MTTGQNSEGDQSLLLRWYYDRKDRTCKQFQYAGAGGNQNNFLSLTECHERCAGKFQGVRGHEVRCGMGGKERQAGGEYLGCVKGIPMGICKKSRDGCFFTYLPPQCSSPGYGRLGEYTICRTSTEC